VGRVAYLLDSNILSEPTKAQPNPHVLAKWERHGAEVCTASVVIHELHYGVARLPEGKRKAALAAYVQGLLNHPLSVLPYDSEAALYHAQERARLAASGQGTAYADGQIAAIAAVNGLILVSRNSADFRHFSGLRLENWFEP
jgi:tRNA(fMet)-specific endonuclease VapC